MNKISKIIPFSIFISVLFGVLLVAFSASNIVESLSDQHIRSDKARTLNIATKSIRSLLWNYDLDYVDEVLQSFIDEELGKVIAIQLQLTNGQIISSLKLNQYKDKTFEDLKNINNVDFIESDVIYSGRNLGTIKVLYSSLFYIETLNKLKQSTFFGAILIACFITFVTLLFTHYLLTSPLKQISKETKKISEGYYQVQFGNYYFEELNLLTAAFEQTLLEIEARDRKLHQHNIKLNELVDQRTEERDVEREKSFQSSRLASLGEMAAGVAHEVNNPLCIIKGNAQSLRSKLDKRGEEALSKHVKKIINTTDRISSIINGMRTFSRDGSVDEKISFKLIDFVDEFTALLSGKAKEKGVKFDVEFDGQESLYANKTQLGQVLINLVNNAIDAIEELEDRWVRISFSKTDNKMIIRVTDSGNGIERSIQDKIMDPFFTTKAVDKGTGLGLSVSYGIIKAHGGDFYYNDSSENTQFVIVIPANKELDEDA